MKRSALEAAINLGIACDRIQAAHYGLADDVLVRQAVTIQRLILGLADDHKKAHGIKEERPRVFKPAFPKSERRFL